MRRQFVFGYGSLPAEGGLPCRLRESVDGYVFEVTRDLLEALDHRERNYDRCDVTGLVDDLGGRVWAYVGSAAGRRRLEDGRRRRSAVVSRGYLESVRAAFGAVHVPPDLPVRRLLRCDVGA